LYFRLCETSTINFLPSIISDSAFTSLAPIAMTHNDENLTVLKAKKYLFTMNQMRKN